MKTILKLFILLFISGILFDSCMKDETNYHWNDVPVYWHYVEGPSPLMLCIGAAGCQDIYVGQTIYRDPNHSMNAWYGYTYTLYKHCNNGRDSLKFTGTTKMNNWICKSEKTGRDTVISKDN